MRWQTTKLIAAFVLFAAASPATAWEGDTLKVGGGGGQEFHDFCGPGEAVVGITYKASKDLNVIWMTCQPMRDGHLEGRPSDHGAKGFYVDTGHGSSQGWIGCPAPMVVQAIYASESAVRVVHDFWLRCRNLVTGEHHNSDWSLTQGGQGGATGNADCGEWRMTSLRMTDRAGNAAALGAESPQLARVSFGVMTDLCDSSAPYLESLTLSPTVVSNEISSEPLAVTVTSLPVESFTVVSAMPG